MRLFVYHDEWLDIAEGDVIERVVSGRTYRVLDARRGPKRWTLDVMTIDPASVETDDHIIGIITRRRR